MAAVGATDTGLSTRDLIELNYPAMKYHALYANPDARKLPPATQGRVVVKIHALKFVKSCKGTSDEDSGEQKYELCVCFDGVWQSIPFAMQTSTKLPSSEADNDVGFRVC